MWKAWIPLCGGAVLAAFAAVAGARATQSAVDTSKAGDTVSVSGCWIRQLPAPVPSGAYFVLHNAGASAIVLQAVSSPDYGKVMMHQTTESGGMSSMSMVEDLQVPAHGKLKFSPGGYHLMLEAPRAALKVGEHAKMEFLLADGRRFSTSCKVRPANAMPSDGKSMPMSN